MLLTKDTEKTFDELTMQLCMFQRNLTKINEKDNADTEAFAVRTQKTEKKKQGPIRNTKSDTCNYCKKKENGKPMDVPKPECGKNAQGNTAESRVALISKPLDKEQSR